MMPFLPLRKRGSIAARFLLAANRNFRVLIMAFDCGSPPMSSTATVNVAVEDSNNLPVFTPKNSGSGGTDRKGIQPTMDPFRTNSPLIYTLNHNTIETLKKDFQSRWVKIIDENQSWLYWKCKKINNLEDNMVSYMPHAYAEEGTLEKSKSLLSLLVPEDEKNLPNNLLDDMGSIFDPLRKICSK